MTRRITTIWIDEIHKIKLMKLVKPRIDEISKGKGNVLSSIDAGRMSMLRRWAAENFDDYSIKDGVIYPADIDECPSAAMAESGKIPDYVKVLAFKPFDLVKTGDVVKFYDVLHSDEYIVVGKYRWNDPKLKDIIIKEKGIDVYDNVYDNLANKINVVSVIKYNNDEARRYLFLYDFFAGVMSTFIYNGDK